MLFTEHDMDVVFAHADRIIVLVRGEMIAEGRRRRCATTRACARSISAAARRRRRRRAAMPHEHADRSRSRGLDAWYGQAQILSASRSRRRRRVRRPDGPQRRRQVDDDEGDHGTDGAAARPRALPRPRHLGAAAYRIARLGLGWVPEDRRIFTDLTVRENLEVGAPAAARGRADLDARAGCSRSFPNLAAMPDRPGGRMSGGEQQMLTVARTLMGNPDLVLLDEPSEGVAPVIVEQMARMIVALKAAGRGDPAVGAEPALRRGSSRIARSCSRRARSGSTARWRR